MYMPLQFPTFNLPTTYYKVIHMVLHTVEDLSIFIYWLSTSFIVIA